MDIAGCRVLTAHSYLPVTLLVLLGSALESGVKR